MLIEMHMIQNHAPSNLNRDDLGAPKTCYFGGVLRSRISSQCLKRSIRTSSCFKLLTGGIRTRRLPQLLADKIGEDCPDALQVATKIIQQCGVLADEKNGKSGSGGKDKKDVIVFLSHKAADRMASLVRDTPLNAAEKLIKSRAREFAEMITDERHMPDMALSGRMLQPHAPKGTGDKVKAVWKNLDPEIEAALQAAHAISTHVARPEVDYFVAADDIKGADAGAAHVNEAMFASACFYKHFSIDWDQLVRNLEGFDGDHEKLAAHTVGAFIEAAALTTPSGKQTSFAANDRPGVIWAEIKKNRPAPMNYANAFAAPVTGGQRDMVDQSAAQLNRYIHDMDVGYGKPDERLYFSPNLRYKPTVVIPGEGDDSRKNREEALVESADSYKNLDEFIAAVVRAIGFDWDDVRKVVAVTGEAS